MTVFVVWKGHRDYEENVVVCETREIAEQYLTDHGVGRPDKYGERVDPGGTPWGFDECQYLGADS